MAISRLSITNFRNLQETSLYPNKNFNLFIGLNGSGKTSLLEAIYYLGLNRSFRSKINKRVIQYNSDSFQIYSKLLDFSVGIEKHLQKKSRIHVDKQEVNSIAEITKQLPLQLIDSSSYQLVDGSSQLRRRFIDWGVFYVEHSFLSVWKKLQNLLKQRNSALKNHLSQSEITVWDTELVRLTEIITQQRREYLSDFLVLLQELINRIDELSGLEVEFYPGWSESYSYQEALENSYPRSLKSGYTLVGAHRADLIMSITGVPIKDYLSRGQKKLFASIFQIAQGIFLMEKEKELTPIYLIDDLPSELDYLKQEQIISLLKQNNHIQSFITCINPEMIKNYLPTEKTTMFHVEQGNIRKI